MKQKVSHFEIKFSILQAFGAIDRTHIPIQRRTENPHNVFNYKRVFFRFQFKQSAVWTLTAHGPIHYIMQKYLQTQT